jgi:ferredoxin
MGVIPEVFQLEDDDTLTLLQDEVTAENEELVLDAIRQCPRQAISISE